MNRLLFIIIVIFVPFSSISAEEGTFIYGLDPALHVDRDSGLNEQVGIIGISYKKWTVMNFTNSYNNTSWLVSKEVKRWDWHEGERFIIYPSLHLGIVHGYEGDVNTIGGFIPWAFISSDFRYKVTDSLSIGLNASLVPALRNSVFVKNFTISMDF